MAAFAPALSVTTSSYALARTTYSAHRCRPRPAAPRMVALDAPVKQDVREQLNRLLTVTPSVEPGKVRAPLDPGREYKVMLLNDEKNSKQFVARVLTRCIPGMNEVQAWAIMQKAHKDGSAVVGVWSAEIAEGYADLLRNNGLRADIQPV